MKKSNFEWHLKENAQVPHEFQEEIMGMGHSKTFANLLWQRGVQTKEQFEGMIYATVDNLHDPFLMHDMQKAVERIQAAIIEGEAILVYGDYDADGITSTSIMKETLEMLGADVQCVLPNRFIHGYGPNQALFEEKINEGIQLIVTVDNGVAGNEAIAYANSREVDVIVTDHHEMPPVLPEAYCIVHPRHPDGNYPFGELAGAGVAFKLATALLEEPPLELLDLACIGTVADLVSMTGENRTIVQLGLEIMKQNQRMGLNHLLKVSGVDVQKLDEVSIGFSIGPRLNAIGRLGDPNPAIELMTTFDDQLAHDLAEQLDKINNERKAIVQQITQEAMTMLEEDSPVQVLAKEGWNPGVLGIVAGNVLKQTGHPAIVLAINEEGIAKGSGRSSEALDMYGMLTTMREYFTHFGGHEAAIGVTLPSENLIELKQQIALYIQERQIDLLQGASLAIDEELSLAEVNLAFAEELKQLAPFGTDNPAPHFLVEETKVAQIKAIGADQQHVKFMLTNGNQQVDVIGFGFGAKLEELQQESTRFVGDLEINEWNGQKKVQLKLLDFATEGLQVIDRRAKHSWNQPLETASTLYLAFQEKSRDVLTDTLQHQVQVYNKDHLTEYAEYRQLVVVDCPSDKELIKSIISNSSFERVYLFLYSADEAYLNGMPNREQFKQLYQFCLKQKRLDIRYKLKNISNFLRISEKLLVFMIRVFSELKFVTIDDGVLEIVENPQNQAIEESRGYKERMKQIESEEFLLMSDIQTIRNWLKS
ncbi:single-stranded-DNA-specific exonuclease RecJ [Enterococcus sp. AZ109]|uniref:single-stranded-DNA-specific exonuclease RecJ n=1 Tax=Enterococcus sp. AZ109 TaxID=2774634 RepID=UPI003F688BC1